MSKKEKSSDIFTSNSLRNENVHYSTPLGKKISSSSIGKLTDKTFSITESLLSQCPRRFAGTEACTCCADIIREKYQKNVGNEKVFKESFTVHPNALLSFFKIIAINYLISFVLFVINTQLAPVCLALFSFTLVFGIVQFVFYKPYFDKFHKKATGQNVYTEIEPEHEVKQQIVVSGHHDSPNVFTYIENLNLQKYYAFRIMFGLLPAFYFFGYFLYWTVVRYGYDIQPQWELAMQIVMGIFLFFTLPFFNFASKKVSPGAGDNLIVSSATIALSSFLGKDLKLSNTRVILASMDAEESGLRGARAFRIKNQKKLSEVPTYALVVDGIYQMEELQLLSHDINGFIPLSKNMAEEVQKVGKKLGYDLPVIRMPFGGGATDAGEFHRAKIETTTLIGIASNWVREELHYHTSRDTLDKVSRDAVKGVIEIILAYILEKDTKFSSQ